MLKAAPLTVSIFKHGGIFMGKIILKDGIENQARAECGLANLFINLADFEELKTLSQRLTKPGEPLICHYRI